MTRRILITGGTGLLGSQVVAALRNEFELHALGRRAIEGAHHIAADLAAGIDAGALPRRIDAVIHLAQSRWFRDFPTASLDIARVNCFAAVELADYAVRAGASHFIYASTGGVYAPAPTPRAETAALLDEEQMGFYPATKRAAERLLWPFSAQLQLVVLRPFFIYGPGQDRSMLIPRLVDSVQAGQPIFLAGQDGIRINPIHVADASAAVRASIDLSVSQLINLAGPETLTIRKIAEEIGAHVGREPVFTIDAAASPGDLVGDCERMARLLLEPTKRLRDHLSEMIE
jgi:nucleoside-diphosphate-sugar epimerase